MVTFILVRHGSTVYNQTHRFTGQLDIDLAPLGKLQAECTAQYLAEHYTVDAIYASSLKRACDTAAPLAQRLGLTVIPERDLQETDVGDWQDYLWDDIAAQYPDEMAEYQQNPISFRFPNGESSFDVRERAMRALKRIATEHDGKTVVIYAHGGVIRTLCRAFFQKASEESCKVPPITNTSISVIQYDLTTDRAKALQIAFTEHLKKLSEATSGKIL